MKKDQLLAHIIENQLLVERMERIDDELDQLYKHPFSPKEQKVLSLIINGVWLTGAVLMALNYPTWLLLALPILYWWTRGDKMAVKINAFGLKRKLEARQDDIQRLIQEKADTEHTLHSMTLLEKEFLQLDILKRFQYYIDKRKAASLETCIKAYRIEQAG